MITFKVDNLKLMHDSLNTFTEFLKTSGADEDDIFASKLVSCELITNVIRHGGDEAEFTGSLSGDKIFITVAAESLKGVDVSGKAPDVFAESGRGLYIVKCFSYGEIERGDGGEIKVVIKR
ncbi:MAG: ATP-binding protein, partial [Clostridia bacterium]|nr:ATP-binding protein [Clostridia bacterium]